MRRFPREDRQTHSVFQTYPQLIGGKKSLDISMIGDYSGLTGNESYCDLGISLIHIRAPQGATSMESRQVEYRPPGQLKPSPSNARTHNDRQIGQIADSIRAFGFMNPVLVDSENTIIAGHGRVLAAQRLGLAEVPVLHINHLSAAQKRAYITADNRLAELAGWDRDILRIELQHLLDTDIDFEVTDIGFEVAEIDLLLHPDELRSGLDPADEILPEVQPKVVSKEGDLWLLGPHRLLCGDALEAASYLDLMAGERARVIFTDPPYNLRIGKISGRGAVKHREFVMASGEMSEAEFTRFLSKACGLMAVASEDGALHYICMDWRHLGEIMRAGRIAYAELLNLCIWTKSAGAMGSLYRSQHELVFVFKNGTAPHLNNVRLGRFGRTRTNLWSYPGLNSFQRNREATLALHPTVKPVALVADAILDCSHRNDIVLDPFAGSGTSIIAAHRTGRRCFAMEIDPLYLDVALRRVKETVGIEPLCARSGQSFTERELQAGQESSAMREDA